MFPVMLLPLTKALCSFTNEIRKDGAKSGAKDIRKKFVGNIAKADRPKVSKIYGIIIFGTIQILGGREVRRREKNPLLPSKCLLQQYPNNVRREKQ